MYGNSNTTLVKVKFSNTGSSQSHNNNSNTTLVKVKFNFLICKR